MEELILEYLRKNGKATYDDLSTLGQKEEIDQSIKMLEDQGIIIKFNKLYAFIELYNMRKGIIMIRKNGLGFVRVLGMNEDIYVPSDKVLDSMDGDTVLIRLNKEKRKGIEGEVYKVLERGSKMIVGTFNAVGNNVIPDDKHKDFTIYIPKDKQNGAINDHKVKVNITNYKKNNITGEIIEIIGHKNDPGVDILSIIANYDIPMTFPQNVLDEVSKIPNEVSEYELYNRRDLTKELIITIDGDDAKDLDDAISLSKLSNGNYLLGVHIADVSNYVKEHMAVDDEAYYRGTSIYLVDRVIPMIPHRLSNGICSLNEGVIRLTMSCVMEIDINGEVVSSEIFQSFIKSSKRMTYKNSNKILDKDKDALNEFSNLVDMFDLMKELKDILFLKRHKRGSIDFETKEPKIKVDELGNVLDISVYDRGESEQIIEEFMLAANETVAETIFHMDLPFIYRVHERPNEKKLLVLFRILRSLGYNIRGKVENISPKELSHILDNIDDKSKTVIHTLMLRSMAKARYSNEPLGHYGLAAKYYTHFTSPIRRYPDTIVHRLLKEYLINGNLSEENVAKWNKKMPEISLRTSKRERISIDCEREVDDMKCAQYMEGFIGEEFKGIVSSVTNFGLFVELPNTIEGMVRLVDMKDDMYFYDEHFMQLIGAHKKDVYKIGDRVIVKLKAASKEKSEIDFVVLKHLENNRGKKNTISKQSTYRKSKSKKKRR